MKIVDEVSREEDPTGHFVRGHIYYRMMRVDYDALVAEEFRANYRKGVTMVLSYVFVGCETAGCSASRLCYVFRGCVPRSMCKDGCDGRQEVFKDADDAKKHMVSIVEAARHVLSLKYP